MNKENDLISGFYTGFWAFLVTIIVLTALIVVLFLCKQKILKPNIHIGGKVVFYVGLVVILAINVVFTLIFSNYCKDLSAVQKKQFETITGTVIGYNRVEYDESKGRKYSNPIVEDIDGKKVVLMIGQTEFNSKYTFIYLEHTRLAVIVEKH